MVNGVKSTGYGSYRSSVKLKHASGAASTCSACFRSTDGQHECLTFSSTLHVEASSLLP